jgi:hypothetical protein
MRDEWIAYASSEKQANVFTDIDIYEVQEHGIYADHAHDTYYANIVVCNASQKLDNTYDGVHLTNGSGGRFVHYHGWSATQGYRDRYSLCCDDNSPLEISESHLEGSRSGCIYVTTSAMVTNTRFYVSYSADMITVAGGLNSFVNCIFQPNVSRNTKCVKMLENARLNTFICSITDGIPFADEDECDGKNNYMLSWFGNLNTKSIIKNLKATSNFECTANYLGNYCKPSNILSGNVDMHNNIAQGVLIVTDPTDGVVIHDERTVIVTSNQNNTYLSAQSDSQRVGRELTVKNISGANINCYFTSGTTIDGVESTNHVIEAGSTVRFIKYDVKKWATI